MRLNEIDDEMGFETMEEHCSNAGEMLDDETSLNLAVGNLNPFTMKQLDNWHPDKSQKVK